jgi:gliding motility associated protien GldN
MKKLIITTFLFVLTIQLFAQKDTDKPKVMPIYSIFQKSEAEKTLREKDLGKSAKNCAPALPNVKSDDVIFAKRITRELYFVDPANRYLAPVDSNRNFVTLLLRGISTGKIDAYQTWNPNTGRVEELIEYDKLLNKTESQIGLGFPQQFTEQELLAKCGLRVVEDWYFDTNRAEFKAFIIAIGFIFPSSATNSSSVPKLKDASVKLGETGGGMTSAFWVNYPTIRNYICQFNVYHPNEKIKYSFDDAFQLRYFSSLIVQESNPDDYKLANRPDLKSGLDKLLEADRIKKSLIQYEQDMWQH